MSQELIQRLQGDLPLGDGSYWSRFSIDLREALRLIDKQAKEISVLKISHEVSLRTISEQSELINKVIAIDDELRAEISLLQKVANEDQAELDELRAALARCRNWFESQQKVVSKGCGSEFTLMQLRDERDAIDYAISKQEPS